MNPLKYLGGYPPAVLDKARQLIDRDELGDYLARRHPGRHAIQNDKALYAYVNALRQEHLRHAPGIDRVWYDSKLDVIGRALGLHTAISHVHGGRLKARKEIRIAALFRDTAPEFLEMIVVHELAHLKEAEHNKQFYQLCEYMQPDYHQQEFDLRLHLTWRDVLASRAA
ncbi:M48 family peptidase [Dyella solisilvae]|uniref:M48 family peptidase n=1 Tax=Dyella solisilvae TaxID=1920168 RepID=A0A370KDA3_9GAMM|nr:YgjP-like metallopeptidase domain-containing protein [Dyella solisilvae]RDJ00542.1 M48 family peptidase [Dyella solisilvae]